LQEVVVEEEHKQNAQEDLNLLEDALFLLSQQQIRMKMKNCSRLLKLVNLILGMKFQLN
jgi:hypothetical protein